MGLIEGHGVESWGSAWCRYALYFGHVLVLCEQKTKRPELVDMSCRYADSEHMGQEDMGQMTKLPLVDMTIDNSDEHDMQYGPC